MSKRNVINLILFVFIISLVAIVVYEPGKEVATKPTILTTLESKSVRHIKIMRHRAESSEQELEFEKTADGWTMLKPYAVSANTFRINSILAILSTVSFSQNNLQGLTLDNFGLDKPVVTITFNNKTTLVFGHNRSLRNHRYIKIDKTLHLTVDTFYYQLAAKPESYISHKLLPHENKIVKLRLPNMTLENNEGNWSITPKAENISADSINRFISEWELSQAYDINKVKIQSNGNSDISIQLKGNIKIHFNIEENKNSFNLINLDTGVRYILSSDRKAKLLTLSNINQDD